MISKIMGTTIPKAAQTTAKAVKNGAKGDWKTRVLKNEGLGKVLEVAADNQNVCQAGFALGICCIMRPASNYVVTQDKKDAWFANAHSIASGTIGFAWPLVFATPLAAGVKHVLKNPQKLLRPELVKKFYPNVGMVEEISKDGTKIKKIATNIKGEMLRKDGSVLFKDLEPLMIYGEENQKAFEAMYPKHYVERGTNVVRIKPVKNEDGSWKHVKTEKGKAKYKDGDESKPIGQAIQAKNFAIDKDGSVRYTKVDDSGKPVLNKDKELILGDTVKENDFTPITEEMEIGALKEKNIQTAINMSSDTLLAPIRASLTIALIPSILNILGIEKPSKAKPAEANAAKQSLNVVSAANNTTIKTQGRANVASSFSAFKKGGV